MSAALQPINFTHHLPNPPNQIPNDISMESLTKSVKLLQSKEQCQILRVVQRDLELRNKDKRRLKKLKKQVNKHEIVRQSIKITGAKNLCSRCLINLDFGVKRSESGTLPGTGLGNKYTSSLFNFLQFDSYNCVKGLEEVAEENESEEDQDKEDKEDAQSKCFSDQSDQGFADNFSQKSSSTITHSNDVYKCSICNFNICGRCIDNHKKFNNRVQQEVEESKKHNLDDKPMQAATKTKNKIERSKSELSIVFLLNIDIDKLPKSKLIICKTCYERSELERLKKASFIISKSLDSHGPSTYNLGLNSGQTSNSSSMEFGSNSGSENDFVEKYEERSNAEFVISKQLAQLLNGIRYSRRRRGSKGKRERENRTMASRKQNFSQINSTALYMPLPPSEINYTPDEAEELLEDRNQNIPCYGSNNQVKPYLSTSPLMDRYLKSNSWAGDELPPDHHPFDREVLMRTGSLGKSQSISDSGYTSSQITPNFERDVEGDWKATVMQMNNQSGQNRTTHSPIICQGQILPFSRNSCDERSSNFSWDNMSLDRQLENNNLITSMSTPKEYRELENDLKSMRDQLESVISRLSKINKEPEYPFQMQFSSSCNHSGACMDLGVSASGLNMNLVRSSLKNGNEMVKSLTNSISQIEMEQEDYLDNGEENSSSNSSNFRHTFSFAQNLNDIDDESYKTMIRQNGTASSAISSDKDDFISSILDLTEMGHIIDKIEEESRAGSPSTDFDRETLPEDIDLEGSISNDFSDGDLEDSASVSNMMTPTDSRNVERIFSHDISHNLAESQPSAFELESSLDESILTVDSTSTIDVNAFLTNSHNTKSTKSASNFNSSGHSAGTGISKSHTFSHANLVQDFERLYINKASFSDDLLSRWLSPVDQPRKTNYNNVLDWNMTNDDLLSVSSVDDFEGTLPLRRALGTVVDDEI